MSNYLVIFVLDNPDMCHSVLDAWEEAGARGITILESSGIGRIRRKGIRDDLPLMPSISDVLRSEETHHRTIFSVVDDLTLARKLAEVSQKVVGGLEKPHTGLLFVLPVLEVYGLNKEKEQD